MSIYGNDLVIAEQQKIDYEAINEALSIINEAYIGKTKTLLEAEEAIHAIRQKMVRSKDLDKLPEVLAFNRLMEKQFGMDVFALHIIQSEEIDAYTRTIGQRIDVVLKTNTSKLITGDLQNGFRYVDGNTLCVVVNISMGFLTNQEFTDEEIMAVILHEIGHNIGGCIYDTIRFDDESIAINKAKLLLYKAAFIITIPLCIYKYRQYSNSVARRKAKSKFMNPIRGWIQDLIGRYTDNKYFKIAVANRLTGDKYINAGKKQTDANNPNHAEILKSSLYRQDEVIADKIPGIYGYGPAQASALLKMYNIESAAEKYVKSLGSYAKRQNTKYNIAMLDRFKYDDEHPHVIQRVHTEIDLLKRELKREGHDPKYEKVIKEQIKQLEQILEDNLKLSKHASKDERAKIEYYRLINSEEPNALDNETEDLLDDIINNRISVDVDKLLKGDKK